MDDPNDPDDPIHPDGDREARPPWDASDTLFEEVEYLGSYDSVADYLRAMLEPEVTPACGWLLNHVDYDAVQRRWESDGCRLVIEHGHIYRVAAGPHPHR